MTISREFFVRQVALAIGAEPDWRYGQTVFNVAAALLPERANALRGTPLDPFHCDEVADAFLDLLFGDGAE